MAELHLSAERIDLLRHLTRQISWQLCVTTPFTGDNPPTSSGGAHRRLILALHEDGCHLLPNKNIPMNDNSHVALGLGITFANNNDV